MLAVDALSQDSISVLIALVVTTFIGAQQGQRDDVEDGADRAGQQIVERIDPHIGPVEHQ